MGSRLLAGCVTTGVELVHEDSKEARTLLHRVVSKHSACFRTRTELRRGGVQTLVVTFSDRATRKKRKRTEPEVYLQFVLEKVGVSVVLAASVWRFLWSVCRSALLTASLP